MSKIIKTLKLLSTKLVNKSGAVKNKVSKSSSISKEAASSKQDKAEAQRRDFLNKTGHFKYGLYTDDLINDDRPIVKIAIKRLPAEVYDQRTFRLIRALHLDSKKIHLPEEEWVTYEEDVENRYLTPYIEEVTKEVQEKLDWGVTREELYGSHS